MTDTARRAALIAAGTLALCALLLYATYALADEQTLRPGCHVWKEEIDALRAKFGEAPAFIAATEQGVVLTITLNPVTGTWTALMQSTPDIVCVAAAGKGWESAPPSVANPPPPVPKPQIFRDGNGRKTFLIPVSR